LSDGRLAPIGVSPPQGRKAAEEGWFPRESMGLLFTRREKDTVGIKQMDRNGSLQHWILEKIFSN